MWNKIVSLLHIEIYGFRVYCCLVYEVSAMPTSVLHERGKRLVPYLLIPQNHEYSTQMHSFWFSPNCSCKRMKDDDELLNQGLIGLLECPVCMEYMGPPIHQCRRGHLVCSACKPKLPNCPTCRSRFTESRNLAMEKVRMNWNMSISLLNHFYDHLNLEALKWGQLSV
jgi:hypothetical protein